MYMCSSLHSLNPIILSECVSKSLPDEWDGINGDGMNGEEWQWDEWRSDGWRFLSFECSTAFQKRTSNGFVSIVPYAWVETQTTNQRQCNHSRWPEANVGQEFR